MFVALSVYDTSDQGTWLSAGSGWLEVMKANFPTLKPRIQQLERVHRLEARLIKKAFVHLASSLLNAGAYDLTLSWPSRF